MISAMGSPSFKERLQNPGGTRGGFGEFVLGLALFAAGAYLLLTHVQVVSHPWTGFWAFAGSGQGSFGITLIPLCIGIALLFFNGRSFIGWLVTGVGSLFILVGIIAHLDIFFRPTSLFETILMLIMLFGGLGVLARSFRDHSRSRDDAAVGDTHEG